MPDAICDTSPIQYLYQVGKLDLLPRLVSRTLIPPTVASELAEGRAHGISLPDPAALNWVEVRSPIGKYEIPMKAELGPGEAEVLALGLECRDATLILDDAVARRAAHTLGLKFTGTLGLLRFRVALDLSSGDYETQSTDSQQRDGRAYGMRR